MSFPRYESYKDSGVEWLGEVPEHWEVMRLKSVISEPLMYGANESAEEENFTNPRFVRITDITEDGLLRSDTFRSLPYDIATPYLLISGDVLLARSGGTVGKSFIYQKDWGICCFAGYLIRARVNDEKMLATFLYACCQTSFYWQFIFSSQIQATIQNVSAEKYSNFFLPVPSLKEQQIITQFLDQETAKIDNLIAEQQQLIKLLKEKLISMVLSEANSTEYYEVRLENISEKVSRPVNLDEYEYYIPIGLFNRGRGLFHKEARAKDEMGDSDFFWIKENDLILSGQFAWEGSVALADIEDSECVVSHRYPVLRGRKNICLTEYLYAFFLTKHGDFFLNENSRGAAGRNKPLNINSLMKEKIPLPSMELQKKVRYLVHDIKPLQKEIGSQINLLKERRSTLISLVVAGKVDVRNYVPSQPYVEAIA